MSAPKKDRTESGAYTKRRPFRRGGMARRSAVCLAATTALISAALLSTATSASADPSACVDTSNGNLCSTAASNQDGTVTVTNHATDLTTDPVQGHLTAGSYTADDYTTNEVPSGTFDDSFTFTPPAGVTSATFEITGPTHGSFSPPIEVTVTFPPVSSPPSNQTVTPTAPTASTPTCSNPEETVTPSNQDGVVWDPTGVTTLDPGQSVTYTATPASGYEFPSGAQTSYPYSNTFDSSGCNTPPTGPTASFTDTANGLTVNFDASSSTGNGLSYTWDFGDSTTGSGETVSHTYSGPSTYSVTLTVTDSSQATNTMTSQVTVQTPPPALTTATPRYPAVSTPDCTRQSRTIHVWKTKGVKYLIDSKDVSGKYFHLAPSQLVRIRPVADPGYRFARPYGTWTVSNNFDTGKCVVKVHVSGHVVHHKNFDVFKLHGSYRVTLEFFRDDRSVGRYKRLHRGHTGKVVALVKPRYYHSTVLPNGGRKMVLIRDHKRRK